MSHMFCNFDTSRKKDRARDAEIDGILANVGEERNEPIFDKRTVLTGAATLNQAEVYVTPSGSVFLVAQDASMDYEPHVEG